MRANLHTTDSISGRRSRCIVDEVPFRSEQPALAHDHAFVPISADSVQVVLVVAGEERIRPQLERPRIVRPVVLHHARKCS